MIVIVVVERVVSHTSTTFHFISILCHIQFIFLPIIDTLNCLLKEEQYTNSGNQESLNVSISFIFLFALAFGFGICICSSIWVSIQLTLLFTQWLAYWFFFSFQTFHLVDICYKQRGKKCNHDGYGAVDGDDDDDVILLISCLLF